MYKYYDNLESKKIFIDNNGIVSDYDFPKGYFITPNGYLYNTSKSNGHRYNSFVNEYEFIISDIKNKNKIDNFLLDIDYFKDILNHIKNEKYIDYVILKNWLNSLYYLPENISLDVGNTDKKLINQEELTELYKGFCDASLEFYNFFYQNFNENALEKLNNIDNILGNVNVYDKMVEILVRCIGFHKIELHNDKNITTSSLHPANDFYDYLINGYNVWVVPKIVYDNGFKEIDLINSMSISSYKAIERFEDENPDKGKVRVLGL